MAFPLDQAQLLNHLRTSYLSMGDESEYFRRIVAPNYPDNGPYFKGSVPYAPLQNSPPITFEIGSQVKRRIENSPHQQRKNSGDAEEYSRRRKGKTKRQLLGSTKHQIQQLNAAYSGSLNNGSIKDNIPLRTQLIEYTVMTIATKTPLSWKKSRKRFWAKIILVHCTQDKAKRNQSLN